MENTVLSLKIALSINSTVLWLELKGRKIYSVFKSSASQKQNAAGDPDEPSPTWCESSGIAEELKADILSSLKEDISKILQKELKRILSNDVDALKLELQVVHAEIANNMTTIWTKVDHI